MYTIPAPIRPGYRAGSPWEFQNRGHRICGPFTDLWKLSAYMLQHAQVATGIGLIGHLPPDIAYFCLGVYVLSTTSGGHMQLSRAKPVAECAHCGKTSHYTDLIHQGCYLLHDGKRCPGIFIRRLRRLDWAFCLPCNGAGLVERSRCSQCNGDGWIKGRRVRSNWQITRTVAYA